MLPRLAERRLRSALREQPAAALLGPRQVGKTTLARVLGGTYFDLELETERLRLDLEWEQLVGAKGLLVLDEAQAFPEIFPRLRAGIDAERSRTGRFLILGSVSPELMRSVSDALTGRLALVELTPFLWTELENDARRKRLWLTGGYPEGGVLRPPRFPGWQLDYRELLAQRDLPNWGLSAAPRLTMRLMRMLAAAQGQTWNGAALGRSLGLDAKTVGRYVDFLEGAYLIRRLPPYHANLKKRLVKAPKVYWRDSGLAHALLGIQADRQLLDQPWVGASFECHVIEQIIGQVEALAFARSPTFSARTMGTRSTSCSRSVAPDGRSDASCPRSRIAGTSRSSRRWLRRLMRSTESWSRDRARPPNRRRESSATSHGSFRTWRG